MKYSIILLLCIYYTNYCFSQPPKREVRATWIASVGYIDWPKSGTSTSVQKQALISIFNKLQAANMNVAYLQVRPMCDALYKSAYEPWSQYLTGTRGKDPRYDPLAFAIEEAHKRGIELHAWVNPYRYEQGLIDHGTEDNIRKNHQEWILNYPKENPNESKRILDPGNPNVITYILNVLEDLTTKYTIDGIIFDDYFYPYGGTTNEDAYSQREHKPANKNVNDWRRENVNKLVSGVYQMVQRVRPTAKFGIGPFGIWGGSQTVANNYGIEYINTSGGTNAYASLYCDGVAWLKEKSIDYITPQCYWNTLTTQMWGYKTLVPWWSKVAQQFDRHFYSSMRVSTMDPKTTECGLEVDITRNNAPKNMAGHVFYNTTQFFQYGLDTYLKANKFTKAALTPIFTWKSPETLPVISEISINENQLEWNAETKDYHRFAIYLVPNSEINNPASYEESAYLEKVTWEKSIDISPYSDQLSDKRLAVSIIDANGYESEAYIAPDPTNIGNDNYINLNVWGGVQTMRAYASKETFIRVYSITGQLVHTCTIPEGESNIDIPTGMYIVNGIKVIVR